MQKPELKPCPRCGSSEVRLHRFIGEWGAGCNNCGAVTVGHNSKETAVDSWNSWEIGNQRMESEK